MSIDTVVCVPTHARAENDMVYPLEYSFAHMGVGGVIPPGVRKSFYFDQEYPDVSFRMLDYDMWSHPVAVRSIKNEAVRLEQHVLKPLSPDTDQKAHALPSLRFLVVRMHGS
jgi:hypothetical protein